MKIYKGIQEIDTKIDKAVVTIGNFDGVHIGHQRVISAMNERAREIGGQSVVITFDPHPRTFFNPEKPELLISTLEQRVELLEQAGIDILIVQPFTSAFANLEPNQFVKDLLVDIIGAKEVFVSNKFRFGHHARGNLDMLKKLSTEYGFTVRTLDNIHFRHTVVSSSFARQSILDGEMEIARWVLGRPYTIYGRVYPDTQRGTNLLSTPTSNIQPENDLIPSHGIYASIVELGGIRYPAATYIGTRPTFEGVSTVIETHLLGYAGNLYDHRIGVELYKKTRDDIKFTHLTDLLDQIRKDVENVKDYFHRHKDDPHIGDLIL